MKDIEYREIIDKSGWGDGPWQTEADKVQYTDAATGFPALVVRSHHTGALCGYVGVGPDHPAYGKPYDDVHVDVHGGLTFADHCHEFEGSELRGICHTVEDGESDDIWWLGFDCGHLGDRMPGMEATMRKLGSGWPGMMDDPFTGRPSTYKTMGFVGEENCNLARQLKAMTHPLLEAPK